MDSIEITVVRIVGCEACKVVEYELQDLVMPLGWTVVLRPPTYTEREVFPGFPVTYLPDGKIVVGTGVLNEIEEGIESGTYHKTRTYD